ncbi:MAG: PDZ domain-containing protein [Calditrichaeota bacterium]|nr:PDZ domain-containing protein [Calditrichota bacterium]
MKRTASVIFAFCVSLFFMNPSQAQYAISLNSFQTDIPQLINHIKHSIVTVSAKSTHSYLIDKGEGIISWFWNNVEEKKGEITIVGSGVIYNSDGYIVTKSSNLANFEEIKVTLCNQKQYAATYIGTDEFTGLSLIKIEADSLFPVQFGDSRQQPIYSPVVILGNSLGIAPFASFGLINGIKAPDMLIISAQINPGNNGAGVFNLNGELVGVVSAQLTPTTGTTVNSAYQSAGVALASNQVKRIIGNILKMQHEQKGWLGIDIEVDSLAKGKIIISSVVPGSPADRSGLKKGDRLLKYNDSFFTSLDQFASLIENTKPGTTVSIDFIRQNRHLKVFPQIGVRRPIHFNLKKPPLKGVLPDNFKIDRSIEAMTISREYFERLNAQIYQLQNEVKMLKAKMKTAQE